MRAPALALLLSVALFGCASAVGPATEDRSGADAGTADAPVKAINASVGDSGSRDGESAWRDEPRPEAGDGRDGGSSVEVEKCMALTSEWIVLQGHSDDFTPPCEWAESRPFSIDVALTWTAPADGFFSFRADGRVNTPRPTTRWDPGLFILDGECAGEKLACNEIGYGFVTVEVEEGQTITVVLENHDVYNELRVAVEEEPCGAQYVECFPHCCVTSEFDVPAGGIEVGVCGYYLTGVHFYGAECVGLHLPGELDPSCPDSTNWRGERVQGCCRPDGKCGLVDPLLGCHGLMWEVHPRHWYCDERTDPNPPAFYDCIRVYESGCSTDDDCCVLPTYGQAPCEEGVCLHPEGM